VPHDGAEPLDVEMRVLELQRVKRPFNKINSPIERVFALGQLQRF
jgi:hypothetical protein